MRQTGLSRNTVKGMYYGSSKRIDIETLNALYKGLKIKPEELFELVEEAGEKEANHE